MLLYKKIVAHDFRYDPHISPRFKKREASLHIHVAEMLGKTSEASSATPNLGKNFVSIYVSGQFSRYSQQYVDISPLCLPV